MPDLPDLYADVVVVGGGVAGCAAALSAARRGASVLMLTKLSDPGETNTRYAQGGIIYTGPGDSPGLLTRDVLDAGAHAGDPRAARLLAGEGPPLVRRLLMDELAVSFDAEEPGFEGLHLTREGAHSVARIIHHRDTTGSAIQSAISRAVRDEEKIALLPGAKATALALDGAGRCAGVYADYEGGEVEVRGRSVVLATGGLGGLYSHTTNPPGATGDGVALAIAAGARGRDLHYVQFHPTALHTAGERFLISEAVRGEGGVLRDPDGAEFVDHPLARPSRRGGARDLLHDEPHGRALRLPGHNTPLPRLAAGALPRDLRALSGGRHGPFPRADPGSPRRPLLLRRRRHRRPGPHGGTRSLGRR